MVEHPATVDPPSRDGRGRGLRTWWKAGTTLAGCQAGAHALPGAARGESADEGTRRRQRLARLGQERPEHVEHVCVGRVELQGDVDAVVAGPFGQHSSLGDDGVARAGLDEQRRQPTEVGVERGDDRVVDGVPREVEPAELPQQCGRDDRRRVVARPILHVRAGEVDQGTQQHGAAGHRLSLLGEGQQQRQCQTGTGGIPRHRDVLRPHTLLQQPPIRADGVLDRGREGMLGGEAVLRHQHRRSRRHGQGAGQRPVAERAARHVSPAVQVEQVRGPIQVGADQQRGTPPAFAARTCTSGGGANCPCSASPARRSAATSSPASAVGAHSRAIRPLSSPPTARVRATASLTSARTPRARSSSASPARVSSTW